nr:uncharacterized protein LOC129268681 [Lytechinus pictus]
MPEGVSENFCEDLSKIISELLNVPEKDITVQVHPNQLMVRNGSREPSAYIELYHVEGCETEDHKRKVSKTILDFTKQHLHIESSRVSIIFRQTAGKDIGIEGGLWSDFHN